MDIMAERKPTGQTSIDTADYLHRTVNILDVLINENEALISLYGEGAVFPEEISSRGVPGLDGELRVSERIGKSVLAYGLAYMLVLGEDNERARFYRDMYEKARTDARRRVKARSGRVKNTY